MINNVIIIFYSIVKVMNIFLFGLYLTLCLSEKIKISLVLMLKFFISLQILTDVIYFQ